MREAPALLVGQAVDVEREEVDVVGAGGEPRRAARRARRCAGCPARRGGARRSRREPRRDRARLRLGGEAQPLLLRLAPNAASFSSARARQWISSSQVSRSSCPAPVRRRRRPCCSNSVTSSVSASFFSCSETVGWARCSSSAARVTLPRRATASKTMSWGSSPWRKNRRAWRVTSRLLVGNRGLACSAWLGLPG